MFHAVYPVPSSSKLLAIITKSCAYKISQGRVHLHSFERVQGQERTTKNLKQNPDKLLPSHQTCPYSAVYSDHTVAVTIHCHHSPY